MHDHMCYIKSAVWNPSVPTAGAFYAWAVVLKCWNGADTSVFFLIYWTFGSWKDPVWVFRIMPWFYCLLLTAGSWWLYHRHKDSYGHALLQLWIDAVLSISSGCLTRSSSLFCSISSSTKLKLRLIKPQIQHTQYNPPQPMTSVGKVTFEI